MGSHHVLRRVGRDRAGHRAADGWGGMARRDPGPSRSQQFKTGGGIGKAAGGGAEEFGEDDLENMPGFDPGADAAANGFPAAAAGQVDMEDGRAVGVGEDRAGADNLMDVIKRGGLRGDGRGRTAIARAGDEDAAGVGAAVERQSRVTDALFGGEAFQAFMDDIAVFEADDEDAAGAGGTGFHGNLRVGINNGVGFRK